MLQTIARLNQKSSIRTFRLLCTKKRIQLI